KSSGLFGKGSDGNINGYYVQLCHLLQNIQITENQGVFRDNAGWMFPFQHYFQTFSGNFELAFQGLVAIGISGENDGTALPVFRSDFFLQKFGSILFIKNISLKIKSSTITPIF